MLILYTSTRSYTNIVSTKMSSSYFSKIIKFISIKGNDEYECPADVIRKLPCRICKCLFLKLPCRMKHVKKVRIYCTILSLVYYCTILLYYTMLYCTIFRTCNCRFVHGFFTSGSITKCGFGFDVNCH